MKQKLFITLLLLFRGLSYAQTTYNCSNPNTSYSYNGTVYKCGNSTTPGTICYYSAQNQIPAGDTVTGCDTTNAPINSDLVILIVAGLGLGGYWVHKNSYSLYI